MNSGRLILALAVVVAAFAGAGLVGTLTQHRGDTPTMSIAGSGMTSCLADGRGTGTIIVPVRVSGPPVTITHVGIDGDVGSIVETAFLPPTPGPFEDAIVGDEFPPTSVDWSARAAADGATLDAGVYPLAVAFTAPPTGTVISRIAIAYRTASGGRGSAESTLHTGYGSPVPGGEAGCR